MVRVADKPSIPRQTVTISYLISRETMNVEETVYISPFAFLRTMFLIAWSALAHPLSTTTIDMETGECVHD